jgi:glycosyltransferase involved in cell wall biosynthesis
MIECDVCIITQSHPSMNPRMVKEADALSEAGYSISVIAPVFSSWGGIADAEFSDRPWNIVARPQFGPLSPRSTRLAELARRSLAGFAVKQLGISHPSVVRAAWHPSAPLLVSAALQVKARLYIGHTVSGLPAASIAAHRNNAHYAFDAEDFHPGDLPNAPQCRHENRMVRLIESRHLPGCAYITTAAPMIGEAYQQAYGISCPKTVLNVFPRSYAPTIATDRGDMSPGPSIYWFSRTIGASRGLECAIKAIGLAGSEPHLYVRGDLAGGFLDTLQSAAALFGVTDRLHILPPAAPSQMLQLAAAYDIGLAGETGDTRNHEIALSNKLFSYIQAGIPVAMSDIPSQCAFAESVGPAARLYRVDDPVDLAKAIDHFLLNPKRLAKARAHAFRLGQDKLNWETEKTGLVKLVESVIGPVRQDSVLGSDASSLPVEAR